MYNILYYYVCTAIFSARAPNIGCTESGLIDPLQLDHWLYKTSIYLSIVISRTYFERHESCADFSRSDARAKQNIKNTTSHLHEKETGDRGQGGGGGWQRYLWISHSHPPPWGCGAKRLVWIIFGAFRRYLYSQKTRGADYILYYIGRTTTCRYYIILYIPLEEFTHHNMCVAVHAYKCNIYIYMYMYRYI